MERRLVATRTIPDSSAQLILQYQYCASLKKKAKFGDPRTADGGSSGRRMSRRPK